MTDEDFFLETQEVFDLLLHNSPESVIDECDYMTTEGWNLWSLAMYHYGDKVVPKVVLQSYMDELDYEENEGF